MDLDEAVNAAVRAGACNVEAADALSGARPWEETWRRVESGWEQMALSVEGEGWVFDDAGGLWVGRGEAK